MLSAQRSPNGTLLWRPAPVLTIRMIGNGDWSEVKDRIRRFGSTKGRQIGETCLRLVDPNRATPGAIWFNLIETGHMGTDRLWRAALSTSAPTNTVGDSLRIDMWIDGNVESASFVRDRARTVTGVRAAVFDPVGNYAVAPGSGVIHDGKCDSGYGNDLIVE